MAAAAQLPGEPNRRIPDRVAAGKLAVEPGRPTSLPARGEAPGTRLILATTLGLALSRSAD